MSSRQQLRVDAVVCIYQEAAEWADPEGNDTQDEAVIGGSSRPLDSQASTLGRTHSVQC